MVARRRKARPRSALARAIGDDRAAPDPRFIARLTGAEPDRIDATLDELERDLDIERRIRATLRTGGRRFYAQIGGPFDLYAIARLLRPRHVVEVGVSSGISSAHFLRALRANRGGTLHSIDLPTFQAGRVPRPDESPVSIPPDRSSGWAVPPSWTRGWDLRIGPSQELLPRLARSVPRIDLFLHDDLHTPEHLRFELATIRSRLRPGSVVLADNTSWTGDALERFAARWGEVPIRRRGTDLAGFRLPARAPRRSKRP